MSLPKKRMEALIAAAFVRHQGLCMSGSTLGKREKLRLQICTLMDGDTFANVAATCYNLSMKTFCILCYRNIVESQPPLADAESS